VLPDGSFTPDFIAFDMAKLNTSLTKYNLKVHGSDTAKYLKADGVIDKIASGSIQNEELQHYVRWRINQAI
jgi:hypothetical protein